MATRQANAGELVLRLRACILCYALFVICRSCDHGQRYCCCWCRFLAWREQRRRANRRHQSSPEGRDDHRDRQRAYRKRCAQRRWAALGGSAGESAVTESVGNAQLRVVEPSIPNDAVSSQALPRSLPPSQDETVIPKNVTDTPSATLTSPDMMAAGNSGSATATPLRSFVAKAGHRLGPPEKKPDGELRLGGLVRCMICGRLGRFVDPFPPFHFP